MRESSRASSFQSPVGPGVDDVEEGAGLGLLRVRVRLRREWRRLEGLDTWQLLSTGTTAVVDLAVSRDEGRHLVKRTDRCRSPFDLTAGDLGSCSGSWSLTSSSLFSSGI